MGTSTDLFIPAGDWRVWVFGAALMAVTLLVGGAVTLMRTPVRPPLSADVGALVVACWPAEDCACGTRLVACTGCGDLRCLSCDPIGTSDCDTPAGAR